MKNQEISQGTITGIFKNKEDAEKAYRDLIDKGYSSDEITVLMSDNTRNLHFKHDDDRSDLGTKAMEKAGVGSAIGGTAGAIIGALAAIGSSVVVPGIGLIVAGPVVAALTGAGAGGLTGGLIGALVGSGIPKDRAESYENSIKEGGIVLGVTPKDNNERSLIVNDWRTTYSGEEIHGSDVDDEVAMDINRHEETSYDDNRSYNTSMADNIEPSESDVYYKDNFTGQSNMIEDNRSDETYAGENPKRDELDDEDVNTVGSSYEGYNIWENSETASADETTNNDDFVVRGPEAIRKDQSEENEGMDGQDWNSNRKSQEEAEPSYWSGGSGRTYDEQTEDGQPARTMEWSVEDGSLNTSAIQNTNEENRGNNEENTFFSGADDSRRTSNQSSFDNDQSESNTPFDINISRRSDATYNDEQRLNDDIEIRRAADNEFARQNESLNRMDNDFTLESGSDEVGNNSDISSSNETDEGFRTSDGMSSHGYVQQEGDTGNNLNISGNWHEIKGKLMQKYANLTDDDLAYSEGREEEMLGKLQQKTGKSRSELRREINQS